MADHGESIECDEALLQVFALLGKRWNGLLVSVLLQRPAHFAELGRAIPGLSESILADRLAELVEAGLVAREVIHGPPLRVIYRLTERGEGLRSALEELARWALRYYAAEQAG